MAISAISAIPHVAAPFPARVSMLDENRPAWEAERAAQNFASRQAQRTAQAQAAREAQRLERAQADKLARAEQNAPRVRENADPAAAPLALAAPALNIDELRDLYADARFSTAVTSLTWDDACEAWTVTTDRGDEFRATYVVTATGTLSELKLPGIPGIEDFEGHTFHTSRWDYAYTGGTPDGGLSGLAGKRVGVVGTGATGVQVVPKLAEDAGLTLVGFLRGTSMNVYTGAERLLPARAGDARLA